MATTAHQSKALFGGAVFYYRTTDRRREEADRQQGDHERVGHRTGEHAEGLDRKKDHLRHEP